MLGLGVAYAETVDDNASGVIPGPFSVEYYGGDINGQDHHYNAGSQNHFSWPITTGASDVSIASMSVYVDNPNATCTDAVYYASGYEMGSLNQYYNSSGWYQLSNTGGSVSPDSNYYAAGYATANSGNMVADAVDVEFGQSV
jgi:hypothetical protein